ncbi:MAG TPA: SGNH hydrolase domain-containing protein, partial [Janthinobacterium sp.]|nr:SGNH hydrolase domain-containing protein [Janthinobacterium sp.]
IHNKFRLTTYVKSGCPVIPEFERVGIDRHCRDFSRKAFALAESGRYQLVIISQNWTGFSSRSDQICVYEGSLCRPLNHSADPTLALKRVKSAIEAVMANRVHVAVVDATPYFLFNVPRRISRNLFWFGKSENSFDASAFFSLNKEYDELFATLAGNPYFTLLSLRPQLCRLERCAIYDEKMMLPIFKDNDHFNPQWIRQNGGIFVPLAG